jgi:hypothetical protein
MKIADFIAELKDVVAKSQGKIDLRDGLIVISNGCVPDGRCFPQLDLYFCYIKWLGYNETEVRERWGRNFGDFYYTLRMPCYRQGRRSRWIKRLIQRALFADLTSRSFVV